MSNEPHVKRWEVVKRDGTKAIVATYTEGAEVYNADGTPAKLIYPVKEKSARKESRRKLTDPENC